MSNTPNLPTILTQDQAAKLLQISPAWLERQRWMGEGPAYLRYGRAIRYDAAVLIAWVDAHRVNTSSAGV